MRYSRHQRSSVLQGTKSDITSQLTTLAQELTSGNIRRVICHHETEDLGDLVGLSHATEACRSTCSFRAKQPFGFTIPKDGGVDGAAMVGNRFC